MKYSEYDACQLCPRKCNVDRNNGKKGACKANSEIKIGRAAPHYWEEPCISGEKGSGTVFFAGCNLGCIYCQNYKLSRGEKGKTITVDELSEKFLELQKMGVHNINLVTAEHFAPQIKDSVKIAKEGGLNIPVILNCSGYETEETLELLSDVIDIYLVDFKYMDSEIAGKYSYAKDYPEVAKRALEKMVGITEKPVYDEAGMLKSGVVVRHLCLPGGGDDSKAVIEYVYKKYKDKVVLSIMNQYTPMPQCTEHPVLARKLTENEYEKILDFCIELGIEDAYIQEGEAASESFIPDFI